MSETYVVKSKVAETIRGKGMMVSQEAYGALSNHVAESLKHACKRCTTNGRKTVKPFDLDARGSSSETFIVKSKVADLIRSQNMMMGSDTYDALNGFVSGVINGACERCKANGRKTIKAQDF